MEAQKRHPIGLYILFFTEMWERFGFYCMEAVFTYYMLVSQYPYLREKSSQIYGFYLAGVYFTPFLGGVLSEWRLGYTLSILTGGLCMALGYGLLSLEPALCFGLGLLCIVIGNGLFKPNISTLVGKLYPQGDARVDSAFTIFYMGINIGAFIAPIAAAATGIVMANARQQQLAAGEITQDEVARAGYLAVFAMAAVGMLIGELIYLLLGRFAKPLQAVSITAANAVVVPPVSEELQHRRKIALMLFFAINIVFWMAFKQKGNSLAIWAKDRTDLTVPAWLAQGLSWVHLDQFMLKDGQMGKELFASLNPLFVIIFSPLLVALWALLRSLKINVSTPAKLILGFVLSSAAFVVMWRVAATTDVNDKVTPLALVACYAILTLGELCLSPMGLSLVSRLAPAKTRAVWMGFFFVSISIGGYLAGAVPYFTKSWPRDQFFLLVALMLAGGGVLMACAYPIVASALRNPNDEKKS